MQLIVLGMHRSGTSSIAGLFQQAGAHFGPPERAFPVHGTNQKGFFERTDVVRLDDRLLESFGGHWMAPHRFPMASDLDFSLHPLSEEAGSIVRDLDKHPDWFLKDPRMCVTLPFWKPHLSRPVYLLVVRHPLAVARSLMRRGDSDLITGLALWDFHTRAMFQHTHDASRVVVSFEQVMQEPVESVCTLFADLRALTGHHLTTPAPDAITRWFDRELVHHTPGRDALRDVASASLLELYEDLVTRGAAATRPLEPPGAATLRQLEQAESSTYRTHLDLERTKAWKNRHRLACGDACDAAFAHRQELEALLQSWRWKAPDRALSAVGKAASREAHGFSAASLRQQVDDLVGQLARERAAACTPTLDGPHPRYPHENPDFRLEVEPKRVLVVSGATTEAANALWFVAATRRLTSHGHRVNWLHTGSLAEVFAEADWPVYPYDLTALRTEYPEASDEALLDCVLAAHDVVVWHGPPTDGSSGWRDALRSAAQRQGCAWCAYEPDPGDGEYYPLPDKPPFDLGIAWSEAPPTEADLQRLHHLLAGHAALRRVAVLPGEGDLPAALHERIASWGWDSLSAPRTHRDAVARPGQCRAHIAWDATSAAALAASGRPVWCVSSDPALAGVSQWIRDGQPSEPSAAIAAASRRWLAQSAWLQLAASVPGSRIRPRA